ncbi:MAG TPA: hypothetical protein DCD97_04175 [Firmicutes bacterium]|jgi:hypothetical protein|nr:hypothetical protein [Bacillota bacterium]HAA34489.1 hypothetical protein [Bacillota bacterium]
MAHYSREEWKGFMEGTLEEEKSGAMEGHLLTCEQCVSEYLSCFSEEGESGDVIELHPQFTSSVMKRIEGMEAKRRGKAKRRDIFYYSAAACLTLFFMFAGVFEGFAGVIPEIAKADMQMITSSRSGNQDIIEFGWSDKLMNSTLTFLDAMKPKDKEVLD